MKLRNKFFALVVTFALPLILSAAMTMPKGMERIGTWEGVVTGNHCGLMNTVCPVSHVNEEIPVFVPKMKIGDDFKPFYYMVSLPKDKQEQVFGKEVRIKGAVYKKYTTVWVNNIEVKQGGQWKPFWNAPPHKM